MIVRPATPADIPRLMEIERASPSSAHWTDQQYSQLFTSPATGMERLLLVVHNSPADASLGFLVARRVADDWELENIVIMPEARRRGLGKRLLSVLLARARETKCQSVFLEVRESNPIARKFYEQAGFKETGRRKLYYANPLEDAVVYRRSPSESVSE